MNIFNELKNAAQWSKINVNVFLFNFIISILQVIAGLFALQTVYGKGFSGEGAWLIAFFFMFIGIAGIVGGIFGIIVSWIFRNIIKKYKQSLDNAMQSLSQQSIEEVCYCQRSIFVAFGVMYIVVAVLFVLSIFIAFLV